MTDKKGNSTLKKLAVGTALATSLVLNAADANAGQNQAPQCNIPTTPAIEAGQSFYIPVTELCSDDSGKLSFTEAKVPEGVKVAKAGDRIKVTTDKNLGRGMHSLTLKAADDEGEVDYLKQGMRVTGQAQPEVQARRDAVREVVPPVEIETTPLETRVEGDWRLAHPSEVNHNTKIDLESMPAFSAKHLTHRFTPKWKNILKTPKAVAYFNAFFSDLLDRNVNVRDSKDRGEISGLARQGIVGVDASGETHYLAFQTGRFGESASTHAIPPAMAEHLQKGDIVNLANYFGYTESELPELLNQLSVASCDVKTDSSDYSISHTHLGQHSSLTNHPRAPLDNVYAYGDIADGCDDGSYSLVVSDDSAHNTNRGGAYYTGEVHWSPFIGVWVDADHAEEYAANPYVGNSGAEVAVPELPDDEEEGDNNTTIGDEKPVVDEKPVDEEKLVADEELREQLKKLRDHEKTDEGPQQEEEDDRERVGGFFVGPALGGAWTPDGNSFLLGAVLGYETRGGFTLEVGVESNFGAWGTRSESETEESTQGHLHWTDDNPANPTGLDIYGRGHTLIDHEFDLEHITKADLMIGYTANPGGDHGIRFMVGPQFLFRGLEESHEGYEDRPELSFDNTSWAHYDNCTEFMADQGIHGQCDPGTPINEHSDTTVVSIGPAFELSYQHRYIGVGIQGGPTWDVNGENQGEAGGYVGGIFTFTIPNSGDDQKKDVKKEVKTEQSVGAKTK